MTTSESPEAMPPSDDSAKAVGFQLVKYYYTNVSSKPEGIYAMYAKNASLQHHNPFKGDFSHTEAAFSRDKIREHYAESSVFSNCKIQVQNVDAQPSMDNGSVIILCNGEIAFNDKNKVGPSYKFVQSFYIVPKKSDNVTYYDIVNDILRFIPDVDDEFELNGKEEENNEVVETKEESAVTKEEDEEEEKQEEAKTEEKEEVKEEEEHKGEEGEREEIKVVEEEPDKEEEPIKKSSKPISWAARVATTAPPVAKKPASASASPVTSGVSTASSPTAVAAKDKGKKKPSAKKKKEDSPPVNGKNLKKKFTNKRNEEVYPIYIKGLQSETDTEEQLVSLLEGKFGKIDSCKLNNYVALVDFTKQAAQDKAIQVGTVKLNGHELKLEPRIEKLKKEKKTAT